MDVNEFLRRHSSALSLAYTNDDDQDYTVDVVQKTDTSQYDGAHVQHHRTVVPLISEECSSDSYDSAVEEEYERCKEQALRFLDYAPRSVQSLREKLYDRGYSQAIVEEVVQRLVEVHILDDYQYAESLLRSYVRKGQGVYKIRQNLRAKKIEFDVIEQLCDEYLTVDESQRAVALLAERVFQKTHGMPVRKRLQKFWDTARRKGHTSEIISSVAYDFQQRCEEELSAMAENDGIFENEIFDNEI